MTHSLHAVAWTLIHFCWQAAAVAAIYRLVSAAVACRSSQTRYLVSLAALLLMVVSAGATFAWELREGTSPSPAFTTAGANLQAAISTPGFPVTMAPGFVSAPTDLHRSSIDNFLPWIDGLWVLGVGILSARSFGGWWLIKRLRASSTSQAPAAVRVLSTNFFRHGTAPPSLVTPIRRNRRPNDRGCPARTGTFADYCRHFTQSRRTGSGTGA